MYQRDSGLIERYCGGNKPSESQGRVDVLRSYDPNFLVLSNRGSLEILKSGVALRLARAFDKSLFDSANITAGRVR